MKLHLPLRFAPSIPGSVFARGVACCATSIALCALAAPVPGQGRVEVWGEYALQFETHKGPAVDFDASTGLVLVLNADGSLVVWGEVNEGKTVAPTVPPGRTVVDVTAGYTFVAALLDDGTISASGSNQQGQLHVPPLPPGVGYVAVDAGSYFALGLRSDGTVVAWGDGQIQVPVLPAGVLYTRIDASSSAAAAVRSDGGIEVWGNVTPAQQAAPPPPAGKTYLDVAVGGQHALGLLSDGTVVGWGSNQQGQTTVPALPAGMRYLDISASSSFSAALRSDGQILVWGSNVSGQANVPPLGPGQTYVGLAADSFTCSGLRSDGEVITWGTNNHGVPASSAAGIRPRQMALPYKSGIVLRNDGALSIQTVLSGAASWFTLFPEAPQGLTYTDIDAVGGTAILAVRSDGALVPSGAPIFGVVSPPPGIAYTHAALGGGSDVFVVALRSDGTADAWGDNDNGELEIAPAPPGLSYIDVDAGNEFTALLRSDGKIFVVGHTNPTGGSLLPPELPPGTSYVRLSAEHFSISALRDDGRIVSWGMNFYGENDVPPLPADTYYVEVATSGSHTIARRSDGAVLAWGWNNLGQLDVPALPSGWAFSGVAASWRESAVAMQPANPGSSSVYCSPGAPNSVSAGGAALEVVGSASHEFNDSVLVVRDLPKLSLGLFLYAPQQAGVPFGNGTLCLGGGLQRILPPAVSDVAGKAVRFLDLQSEALSTGIAQIEPGSTWNFQYWYRDALAPPAQFNLSSAVQVAFAP